MDATVINLPTVIEPSQSVLWAIGEVQKKQAGAAVAIPAIFRFLATHRSLHSAPISLEWLEVALRDLLREGKIGCVNRLFYRKDRAK